MIKSTSTGFKKLSKRRARELVNTKKWYFGNIQPSLRTVNHQQYLALDVYYNCSQPAQYHTGRDYLIDYLGGPEMYVGTPKAMNFRQFWFKWPDNPDEQEYVKENARWLKRHYDESIGLYLPQGMLTEDPDLKAR
ncbi:MAG: hypothetical protein ACXWF8_05400 [Methylobacter sp.]